MNTQAIRLDGDASSEPPSQAQTQILLEISLKLFSTREIGRIPQKILHLLHKLVEYDVAAILTLDDDHLHIRTRAEAAETNDGQPVPNQDLDFVWQHLRSARQPYLARDLQKEGKPAPAGFEESRSFLVVPLQTETSVVGILALGHIEPNRYDANTLARVSTFAGYAALALDNARIHSGLRQYSDRLELLHTVGLTPMNEANAGEVIRRTIQILVESLGYHIACFYRLVGDSLHLMAQRNHPQESLQHVIPLRSSGPLAACLNGRTPLLLDDSGVPSPDHGRGAAIFAPVWTNDEAYGVLKVQAEHGDGLGENDLRFLTMLTNRLGVALHNVKLYEQQRRRLTTLSALHAGAQDITSDQDETVLLRTFAERVKRLLTADMVMILLHDQSSNQLVVRAVTENPVVKVGDSQDTQIGIVGHAFSTAAPVHTPDYASYAHRDPGWPMDRWPLRAVSAVPLIVENRSIGVLAVHKQGETPFDAEEMQLLGLLAGQIAVAIENRRLFRKELRQRRFVETQLAFSYALMETNELASAAKALLETLPHIAPFDGGSVMLLDPTVPGLGHILAAVGYTDPAQAENRTLRVEDFPLLSRLRAQRTPIYIPDLRQDSTWQPGQREDPQEVRSILLAPMLRDPHSAMIGALTLKSYAPNAFPEETRANILLLCNQTATAVEKIRLYDETRRRLNEVSVLAEMSEQLNRTLELHDMLRFVLDRVMTIIAQSVEAPNLRGAIILRRMPSALLRLEVGYNLSEEEIERFNSRPYYAHEGTFATALYDGEWVELTTPEEVRRAMLAPLSDLDTNQLLNIPLKVGSGALGIITANYVVKDPTTRRLLGAIAELAGYAIQKIQMLADARSRAVELMEAYEALQLMNQQRDEFIQNITHDLRAPLTFIQGYTELMAEGALGDVTEEQMEALDVIQNRTGAVLRLINDMLKAKEVEAEPLRNEEVILEDIAHNAARTALMSARQAGLDIVLDIGATRNRVLGDPVRLGQVFDNLLSNAIKYSPNGGVIRVKVAGQGENVLVSVADNGIGIPADELDRIWDRYYRVKGTRGVFSGTGLGLANVRRIIEAHGGAIWVESDENGTTFSFELPRLQEAR